MIIKINGQESEISDGLSIHDLISARNLRNQPVIIELNGAIVQQKVWAATKITPGDRLEIIRIIGGG